jgi:hypothetical protein
MKAQSRCGAWLEPIHALRCGRNGVTAAPVESLGILEWFLRRVGIPAITYSHTLRATRVTACLHDSGIIEQKQPVARHESRLTTKLYDRTYDTINLDKIERILILSGSPMLLVHTPAVITEH